MDPIIITVIAAVVALLIGIIAGKFLFAKNTKQRIEEAELHAKNIITEAELRAETVKKRERTGGERAICFAESCPRKRSKRTQPQTSRCRKPHQAKRTIAEPKRI